MTCSRGDERFGLRHTSFEKFNAYVDRETRRERILENLKKTLKIKEKQLKMIGKILLKSLQFYHKLLLQKRQRSMKSYAKRNTMKSMGIQFQMQKKDSSRLLKKRGKKESRSTLN